MIGYEEIHSAVFRSSCIEHTNNFKNLLIELDLKPQISLELGAYKGLSTAVLASLSDKVYTFDIKYQPIAEPLWDILGVKDKITYTIVNNTDDIIDYVKKSSIKFDFMFADGPHSDATKVRKIFTAFRDYGIKKILFDDATKRFPGTIEVAQEIGAVIYKNRFAYWEDK